MNQSELESTIEIGVMYILAVYGREYLENMLAIANRKKYYLAYAIFVHVAIAHLNPESED